MSTQPKITAKKPRKPRKPSVSYVRLLAEEISEAVRCSSVHSTHEETTVLIERLLRAKGLLAFLSDQ